MASVMTVVGGVEVEVYGLFGGDHKVASETVGDLVGPLWECVDVYVLVESL